MVARNKNFAALSGSYLFPEINRRKRELLQRQPDAKIISLGIGNTTQPLLPTITAALAKAAEGLGIAAGYSGYGDEQGLTALREKIASEVYGGAFKGDEIFISDGAKCDIARLQTLFGAEHEIAVQDPSYPVYVDGSLITGVRGIRYLTCTPDNDFFPDLEQARGVSLIYFCSPNNPTGAVATKEQLTSLVEFARAEKAVIIFDAAYGMFISDDSLPRSIFDIPGAREVAIEVNSFSKTAGFAGLRLGWSVVPHELRYESGEEINKDWNRICTTLFNGASNVSQAGGLAALTAEGLAEMRQTVAYYMQNAATIAATLSDLGLEVYGGVNAPYVWARFPELPSWEAFNLLLEQAHVVATPGSGFGPAGEGFLRFSGFGHRAETLVALERVTKVLRGRGAAQRTDLQAAV